MAGFYRSLTLDHTQAGSTDTSNFPCFWGGNSSLATVANGGRVTSASGYDIVFCTDPNNALTTKLNFERVWWNASTGAAEFWIQIPTLSHSSSVVIYVYYGDSTITTDQQAAANTWDSNYVAVYHFGDGSGFAGNDSTSNGNNGTNHGSTATTGQIGGAANFASASSEYIDCGAGSALQVTSNLTLECWFKYTGSNAGQAAGFGNNDGAHNGYFLAPSWTIGNASLLDLQKAPSTESAIFTTAVVNFSNPNYLAGVFVPGSSFGLYLNGASNHSSAPAANTLGAGSNLQIGRLASSFYYDGWLDEIRVSKIDRSADYFTATYNNTKTSSTFVTVSSETSGGGTGGGGSSLLIAPGMDGGMRPLLYGGING